MKRFLLPLLAAFALPTAASAESVWLVLDISGVRDGIHGYFGAAIEKIEMKNMSQCNEWASKWKTSKWRSARCIPGK